MPGLRLCLAVSLLTGCTTELSTDRDAERAPPPPQTAPSAAAPAPRPTPVPRPPPPPRPPEGAQAPDKPAALTPEELALIEKDPKDLSPEMRRKRAFALRKKIMKNPDSPSARALEDLRRQAEAGELPPVPPPADEGLHLEARLPPGDEPAPPEDGKNR